MKPMMIMLAILIVPRAGCAPAPKAIDDPSCDMVYEEGYNAGYADGQDLCFDVTCESDDPCIIETVCDPASGLCDQVPAAEFTECGLLGVPGVCVSGICLLY
jgi:hypothetical protein